MQIDINSINLSAYLFYAAILVLKCFVVSLFTVRQRFRKQIDIDTVNLSAYLFYAAILVLKCLSMALLTARQRMSKQVFANQEDVKLGPKGKISTSDPDVERVRRAHQNDLENIPFFLIISFVYLFTNPSSFVYLWLMRVFTGARILHTIVYLNVVPQPARALTFFAGVFSTVYICVQIIISQI